jgi:hypothetical protein
VIYPRKIDIPAGETSAVAAAVPFRHPISLVGVLDPVPFVPW